MNSSIRVYVQAKDDREGGDRTQFTFGPSVQFYRKPLLKLKRITVFDLNDAKSTPMLVESRYRVISEPDKAVENRAIEAVTFHLPLFAEILASDRNRVDLDWQNGSFSWRYRNSLTVERTLAVGSYHLIPYLQAEPFYESQYSKWSTTDLYAGSLFHVGKHVQVLYYEHEMIPARNPTGRTTTSVWLLICISHWKTALDLRRISGVPPWKTFMAARKRLASGRETVGTS